jgi:hypothetical protein
MTASTVDQPNTPHSVEPLLTVGDVSKILRCSRAQVYALIGEGSLQKVPLPYRTTRMTRGEVERLLRGRSHERR